MSGTPYIDNGICIKDFDDSIYALIRNESFFVFWNWLIAESQKAGASRIYVSTVQDFDEEDSMHITQIHVRGIDLSVETVKSFEARIFSESLKVTGMHVELAVGAFRS